jgi:chromosome segregation ATPase
MNILGWIGKYKFIIFIFLVVFGLWSGSWYWIDHYVDKEKCGIFGDKFGAINSLFSGLAFAGVIVTLLMQIRELREQRDDIKKNGELQNEILKAQIRQVKVLDETAKTYENIQGVQNKQLETLQQTAQVYFEIRQEGAKQTEIFRQTARIAALQALIDDTRNALESFKGSSFTGSLKEAENYRSQIEALRKKHKNAIDELEKYLDS